MYITEGGNIPGTLWFGLLYQLPDLRQLLLIEIHILRPKVLDQSPLIPGTGNRNGALCNHPSKRQLTRRASLLICELLELVDDPHILPEQLFLEPRDGTPNVSFGELVGRGELASKNTLAEGRVGNDGDTELLSSVDETVLLVVREPRRVLDLEGVDVGN